MNRSIEERQALMSSAIRVASLLQQTFHTLDKELMHVVKSSLRYIDTEQRYLIYTSALKKER